MIWSMALRRIKSIHQQLQRNIKKTIKRFLANRIRMVITVSRFLRILNEQLLA